LPVEGATLGAQRFGLLLALERLIGGGGVGQDRQVTFLLDCVELCKAIGRDSLAGFSRDQHSVYNFPSCLHLGEARGARGVIGGKLGAGFAHVLRRDMADDFASLHLLSILDRHGSYGCDELGGDYGGLADDKAFTSHVDVAARKGIAEVNRKRDQRGKIDQPCKRPSHDSPSGSYDSFQR
jgi:hypothetical protein